jgi:hypothetical protein
MNNERRLTCISQFNHEKQERKLRQETPQWDYIMEKHFTMGKSASHLYLLHKYYVTNKQ